VDFCIGEILAHPSQLRMRSEDQKCSFLLLLCNYDELSEMVNVRYAVVLLS